MLRVCDAESVMLRVCDTERFLASLLHDIHNKGGLSEIKDCVNSSKYIYVKI